MANGRNGSGRRRQALTGPKNVSFFVDTSGIDGIGKFLDTLDDTVKDVIRPLAQAGAQVFYDRVKLNVAGIGRKSGNLDRAIYQAYMKESSQEGKTALYRVSWNVTKAPHGRLLEWGWVQRYASYVGRDGNWYTNKNVPRPGGPVHRAGYAFIRRAHAALPEAQEAMKKEFFRRIEAMRYYGA